MRVYFDACCLNRPFDDQTQDRIRLEAEAILLLMRRLRGERSEWAESAVSITRRRREGGQWEWIASDVLAFEIEQIPDRERRLRVQLLTTFAHRTVPIGEAEEQRALELEALGFHAFDALHLACAESGSVEVFFTTDDQLLRLARRFSEQLRLKVRNPLTWFEEMAAE